MPDAPPVPAAAAARGAATGPSGLLRLMIVLAFATGAASFAYEIAWIRMLSLGLGASSHAFELMLSAFILGMALGGLVLRLLPGAFRNDLKWLAGILAAKGIVAVAALGVYGHVLEFVAWAMRAVSHTEEGYVLMNFSGHVASMMVMFPAAFCAGMTLPLATNALLARGHGEASIGRIYGANTAGCIVGAAFATHVGMETFGVKGLTGVGAIADLAMAAAVAALGLRVGLRTAGAAAATAAVAAVAVYASSELDELRMASGVFRYGTFLPPDRARVLSYRDGKTATISVVDIGNSRSIRTNGKPDASIDFHDRKGPSTDEPTMVLAGALPFAFKPDARRVANIGFGSGLTTHTALGSPGVELVDSIEIERMMIEGARYFDPHNRRAYRDPRSRIHIDDAKTFFASNGVRYDVIISEPSNPWVSGVSSLFSEEFYALMGRYLADDGLLLQWVQAYEINFELFASIVKALGNHFGDYALFSTNVGDVLLVATKGPRLPPMSDAPFRFPEMAGDLAGVGYHALSDLEMSRIASRRALEPLVRSGIYPANSDYFPMIDTRAAKARFMRENSLELPALPRSFVPFTALFDRDARYDPRSLEAPHAVLNPTVKSAIAARDAWAAFVADDQAASARIEPRLRLQLGMVRDGFRDCLRDPALWVDLVEDLYRLTMPFLDAGAHRQLFARLSASACFKAMPAEERARLEMLDAMAIREAGRAGSLAEGLLASGRKWRNADRAMLVLVAVSGRLHAGDIEGAKGVLSRHGEAIADQYDRLAVRLLLAWVDPELRGAAKPKAELPAAAGTAVGDIRPKN